MEDIFAELTELAADWDALDEARRQISEEFPEYKINGPAFNTAVHNRWLEIVQ